MISAGVVSDTISDSDSQGHQICNSDWEEGSLLLSTVFHFWKVSNGADTWDHSGILGKAAPNYECWFEAPP